VRRVLARCPLSYGCGALHLVHGPVRHAAEFVAEGAGDVRGEQDVGERVERGCGGRYIWFGHIEYSVNAPGNETLGQRVGVDE
jgi:hypothetical protein